MICWVFAERTNGVILLVKTVGLIKQNHITTRLQLFGDVYITILTETKSYKDICSHEKAQSEG